MKSNLKYSLVTNGTTSGILSHLIFAFITERILSIVRYIPIFIIV